VPAIRIAAAARLSATEHQHDWLADSRHGLMRLEAIFKGAHDSRRANTLFLIQATDVQEVPMQRALVLAGLIMLAALPLVAIASPGAVSANALMASAKPAIDAADEDWLPAMRAHDAARLAKPYAGDALFVRANGDTIRGRSAIQKMYQSEFTKPAKVVSGYLKEDGLAAAGSRIYEWGHTRIVLDRGTGKPVVSAGRYLTVRAQDAAGRWKIILNLVF